jgi:hypothetical protein
MRKILFTILTAALALAVFLMVSRDEEGSGMKESGPLRVLTAEQLLNRVHHRGEALRLRTATDVVPGGYAAAMLPLMIDWDASDPFGDDPFVIVHNLNHGGNPIDGTTVFCSARIPLEGIEAAEFILLPLDKVGREGLVQHGQLRFVFAEDKQVELINYGDAAMGSDRSLRDLVVSWEAWRPPNEGYDVFTGMDPAAYLLAPRVFSGPTRFLDDALGERPWFAYRLRMPGGHDGLVELLKVNLALCDGVARHAASNILKQSEEQWVQLAPERELAAGTLKEWEELKEAVAPSEVTSKAFEGMKDENLKYQTLLRSCATMALYSINVATDRLVAAGHTDGLDLEHRMLPNLGVQEEWMTQLADTDLKGIFLRAPAALRHLRAHPEALPKNIPGRLEKAGLLELTNGKPVKYTYRIDDKTPYGTLEENLIK